MPHTLPLLRTAALRAIERAAIAGGLPPGELMRRAGAAAARRLLERWPEVRQVGVLCGPGNNGGDGYELACVLHEAGRAVSVLAFGAPRSAEARAAAARWAAQGGAVAPADPQALPEVGLWVDGLLGLGLARAPEAGLAALLAAVRATGRPVLALDLPTGIEADTGAAPGAFLPATLSVAFLAATPGLFTGKGREAAGEVVVEPLGLEVRDWPAEARPVAQALRPAALAAVLPPRPLDSHKGQFGRVLCLGGAEGMAGALVLCAEAAARSGAGWVEAIGSPEAVAALLARRPEVMARVLPAPEGLAACLARADVLALGPGLGQDAWGWELFTAALASGRPLVLDADALNRLAAAPRPLPEAVLTPHPGEAARLLGSDTAAVQRDRLGAAIALAARFEAAVVLKGAGSVVAAPGKTAVLIDAGNPGMASAGMGDVLTGVVAALRAQGLPPFEAAWAGALAHAAAGDRAAAGRCRGLLAADLLPALGEALNP
ncbi:bifunctional ADP-dependent NAD(P)H-hydrate dehydratase/NAD(P)H-hydrate epimerase [Silanimonas lenta]|uniref:bifunctional ADP-dependent NAD(P)H-hydrate dehydratase/NAD(P)H-hydrate epimerase n=2 Tax=Silanimonas lenta TaxID=265429 RepID=UPI0003FADADD|nr:bifunctional ADP-dependent NAD(P)H-hydrate dehydratase/NAD(P)H-hydrate epimerase [Silanimonas lenta]